MDENKVNVLLAAWNNFFGQITKDARSFLLLLSLVANVYFFNEIKSLNNKILAIRTEASNDVIKELRRQYDPKINDIKSTVDTVKKTVDTATSLIKDKVNKLSNAK